MVDLRKLSFADLAAAAQAQSCCSLEPEAGVKFDLARRSDNPITVDGGGSEAGDELCETTRRERSKAATDASTSRKRGSSLGRCTIAMASAKLWRAALTQ